VTFLFPPKAAGVIRVSACLLYHESVIFSKLGKNDPGHAAGKNFLESYCFGLYFCNPF
jgi:hypothetical protein